MDRGRGNAALILRLQILRHLRDRQIQGDVAEPRHRSSRQRGKLETIPGAERVNAGARGGHVAFPAKN
jgi:hypothetical protein